MKIDRQRAIIKQNYDRFLVRLANYISAIRCPLFQLSEHSFKSNISLVDAKEAYNNAIFRADICKVATIPILIIGIDQDSASEIYLSGTYLNHTPLKGDDDFIAGFQADMWW